MKSVLCNCNWTFTVKSGPTPYWIFFLQIFDQYVESISMYRIIFSTVTYNLHILCLYFICDLSRTFPGQFFIPIYTNHHVQSFWVLGWFPWCIFIPFLRMGSCVTFRAAGWIVWSWPGSDIGNGRRIRIWGWGYRCIHCMIRRLAWVFVVLADCADVLNHSDSEYQLVPFVNSSKWAPFGVFQLHGPLVKLLEQQ